MQAFVFVFLMGIGKVPTTHLAGVCFISCYGGVDDRMLSQIVVLKVMSAIIDFEANWACEVVYSGGDPRTGDSTFWTREDEQRGAKPPSVNE